MHFNSFAEVPQGYVLQEGDTFNYGDGDYRVAKITGGGSTLMAVAGTISVPILGKDGSPKKQAATATVKAPGTTDLKVSGIMTINEMLRPRGLQLVAGPLVDHGITVRQWQRANSASDADTEKHFNLAKGSLSAKGFTKAELKVLGSYVVAGVGGFITGGPVLAIASAASVATKGEIAEKQKKADAANLAAMSELAMQNYVAAIDQKLLAPLGVSNGSISSGGLSSGGMGSGLIGLAILLGLGWYFSRR